MDISQSKEFVKGHCCGSTRSTIGLLCSLGFFVITCQRLALETASQCMTNRTFLNPPKKGNQRNHIATEPAPLAGLPHVTFYRPLPSVPAESIEESGCQIADIYEDGIELPMDGILLWKSAIQKLVASSFDIGYMVVLPLAGRLGANTDANKLMGWGGGLLGLATILFPPMANYTFVTATIVRILAGMSAAAVMVGMYGVLGRWCPPGERAAMIGLIFTGETLARSIQVPLSFTFCLPMYLGYWPALFYFMGSLSIIWGIIWGTCGSHSPDVCRGMSYSETVYLQHSLEAQNNGEDWKKKGNKIPWCYLLKSLPIWALIVGMVTVRWLQFMLVDGAAGFFNDVLNFDIKQNSLFSTVPWFFQLLFLLPPTLITKCMLSNSRISLTYSRKICHSFGTLLPAFLLLAMGFMRCHNWIVAMVMWTLALCFYGISVGGVVTNQVDVVPHFAGGVHVITHMLTGLLSLPLPYIITAITSSHSPDGWRVAFYLTIGLTIICTTFYNIFGSSDVLPVPGSEAEVNLLHEEHSPPARRRPSTRGCTERDSSVLDEDEEDDEFTDDYDDDTESESCSNRHSCLRCSSAYSNENISEV